MSSTAAPDRLPSKDPTRESLYVLLRGAAAEAALLQNARMARRGLTASEYAILDVLHFRQRRPPSVPDLARTFHLNPKSVAQTVHGLQARGLVVLSKVNGKPTVVSLTPMGEDFYRMARAIGQRVQTTLRRRLGRRDADLLIELLVRFLGAGE